MRDESPLDRAHRRMRAAPGDAAAQLAGQAIRAGYDEIQHANMLALNFLFDEVQDTRTPARFTAVAEKAHALDLASPKAQAFLDRGQGGLDVSG